MAECIAAEWLLDFVTGRMRPEDEERTAEHLAECHWCRELADTLSDQEMLRRESRDAVTVPLTGEESQSARLQEILQQVKESQEPFRPAGGNPLQGSAIAFSTGPADAPVDSSATLPEILDPTPHSELPVPQRLGRMRLKRPLGFGSFGVVWLAEDELLGRAVALKLPRVPALLDPRQKRRFMHEARATAALRHPNIVPVYEAGEIDDVPYLASAYCSGPTLAQWLAEQGGAIAPDVSAELVRRLAEAVEHAHENGILHRDIKPGNVLLDLQHPSGRLPFTPMLTDFGLARVMTGDSSWTAGGHVVGTPRYMAPEQALGNPEAVGPPADVYALGVLLYESLTGRCPTEGDSAAECLSRLASEIPTRPRQHRREIPRDLEAACLKCLEKSPERRYQSAGDLADDLARFLAGQAMLARSIGAGERLWRWSRRRPAMAVLLVLLVLSGSLAAAGLSLHTSQVQRLNSDLSMSLAEEQTARRRAEQSEERVQNLLYVADIRLAGQAQQAGDLAEVDRLLRRHAPQSGGRDQRGFEWHLLSRGNDGSQQTVEVSKQSLYTLDFSQTSRQFAVAGQDGIIRLYDSRTYVWQAEWPSGQKEVNGVAYSPDGRLLASAGDDGTVCLWDLRTQKLVRKIQAHEELAFAVQFYADGQRLVTCGADTDIRLWDRQTGRALGTLKGHSRTVEALSVSPDGHTLASAGSDQQICLWDLDESRLLDRLQGSAERVLCVGFSPDGRRVAAGGLDRLGHLWNLDAGRQLSSASHIDSIQSVAFSPDGRRIAFGDRGGTVSVWPLNPDTAGQQFGDSPLVRWHAHEGRVYALAFSPDGRQVLSAGQDGQVDARDFGVVPGQLTLSDRQGPIRDFEFVSGRHIVATLQGQELALRDATQGGVLSRHLLEKGTWKCLASSPAADCIAMGGDQGRVLIWDLDRAAKRQSWDLPLDSIALLTFSPDGKTLVCLAGGAENAAYLVDVATGKAEKIETQHRIGLVAFSPDGEYLARTLQSDVQLWNHRTTQVERTFRGHREGESWSCLAFDPQGLTLAAGGGSRQIWLWDVRTGKPRFTLGGHPHPIWSAAFSLDGRSLVSADQRGGVKIWHTATGQLLCDLDLSLSACRKVQFSADGEYLAALDRESGIVKVIDTAARVSPDVE